MKAHMNLNEMKLKNLSPTVWMCRWIPIELFQRSPPISNPISAISALPFFAGLPDLPKHIQVSTQEDPAGLNRFSKTDSLQRYIHKRDIHQRFSSERNIDMLQSGSSHFNIVVSRCHLYPGVTFGSSSMFNPAFRCFVLTSWIWSPGNPHDRAQGEAFEFQQISPQEPMHLPSHRSFSVSNSVLSSDYLHIIWLSFFQLFHLCFWKKLCIWKGERIMKCLCGHPNQQWAPWWRNLIW